MCTIRTLQSSVVHLKMELCSRQHHHHQPLLSLLKIGDRTCNVLGCNNQSSTSRITWYSVPFFPFLTDLSITFDIFPVIFILQLGPRLWIFQSSLPARILRVQRLHNRWEHTEDNLLWTLASLKIESLIFLSIHDILRSCCIPHLNCWLFSDHLL